MDITQQKIIDLNNTSTKVIREVSEITFIGNPILRKKTNNVSYLDGLKIGKDLLKILAKYRDVIGGGIGLAAPQINSSANVFVTFVKENSKIFINPEITYYSDTQNLYKENCLSSSHVWCDVQRSENILISYVNELGDDIVNEKYDSFVARLIQHEYDHLQGIVNLDKAIAGTIEYKTGNPRGQKLREV